ncbi:glycosyltransferase family 2 protein [Bifidobacterium platyrrhinorum]|uniref:Glycosyltransferase n=1 Tax=Bifidobacterium platyrrhinorum TaxID=2661628 RepID=A0A6L9SRQ1_9BIFI|nr:glycosyltransferase family 2 protein [Bifidobacterium platyrrhinorum]NEG54865.1 glycosyltransferase [Bifidobacterium platyrrhinorum]
MLLTTPPNTPKITPLVSIIVPVHNAERYVRYCVDSILRQSYTNLEILLVDRGSDDMTPAILNEYASRDDRVRTTRLPSRDGVTPGAGPEAAVSARNAGLDAAHGTYLAFADQHDILDRRNIELLLHALIRTGADMAKARSKRFGVSTIYDVAEQAAEGAKEPDSVTLFTNPLEAYETVFCKAMRLTGDQLGRNTEARYLGDEHWCRLYRRETWDGIRFPELEAEVDPEEAMGDHASAAASVDEAEVDAMVAGELYARMDKIADIDVILYHRLVGVGVAESGNRGNDDDTDTADQQATVHQDSLAFAFHHARATAAARDFRLSMDRGILPERSYALMTNALRDEEAVLNLRENGSDDGMDGQRDAQGEMSQDQSQDRHALQDRDGQQDRQQDRQRQLQNEATYQADRRMADELIARLSPAERMRCTGARQLRRFERHVRDAAIRAMR